MSTQADQERRKAETIAALEAALDHAKNGFPEMTAHHARRAASAAMRWTIGKPYPKPTEDARKNATRYRRNYPKPTE